MAGEKMDRTYIAGSTGNAALMAFTKALGGSAGDDKLRVVGINPGAIATDRLITIMKARAKDRLGEENKWEELMQPLPMGRAGTPEEIGVMVARKDDDPVFVGVVRESAQRGERRLVDVNDGLELRDRLLLGEAEWDTVVGAGFQLA